MIQKNDFCLLKYNCNVLIKIKTDLVSSKNNYIVGNQEPHLGKFGGTGGRS